MVERVAWLTQHEMAAWRALLGVSTRIVDLVELLHDAAPEHVRLVREHFIDLLTPGEQRQVSGSLGKVLAHLRADPNRRSRG